MNTVLITGGAGFIGRHVAREFARQGWQVVGCDQTTVDTTFMEVWGLSAFRVLDLAKQDLDYLLQQYRPDVLVHAAGPASVPESMRDPAADFKSSAVTLFNVLDSIRRCAPDCRLVFLSSAAVYGNPQKLPVAEGDPLRPISPYGFHKMLCEKIVEEFRLVYGLKACSLRIFSAYGAGLRRQVLWDICQKALNGPVVELFGTGQETRDFIHVEDIARALGTVVEAAEFRAEVYNVGNGGEVAIRDLANGLLTALGKRCDLHFTGIVREGDPLRWCADVTRLHALGYQPTVSIEQGVTDYARWVLKVRRLDDRQNSQTGSMDNHSTLL